MITYVPFHDTRKWTREGMRTRDAHVARVLSSLTTPDNLLVLDRPTCLAEYARLRGGWKSRGNRMLESRLTSLTVSVHGFHVVDALLPSIGFKRGSFHAWLLDAYRHPQYVAMVEEAIATIGAACDPILWLCHPFAGKLPQALKHTKVVVDAFDNFAVHPELHDAGRAAAREGYRLLTGQAEAIVVNSNETRDFLIREFGRDSLVVPNGVDPTLFRNATPMPLPGLDRPLIGYAGKLGKRIDVELLVQLAEALDKGTIVIAGQLLNKKWMAPVLKNPRIKYLGDLHYSDLPAFVEACDLCLVPHRVGGGENHGDATKIYEYLAAGKLAVTTPIGGTDKFAGRVVIAASNAEFIEAVRSGVRGELSVRPILKDEETWHARVQVIAKYFQVDIGKRAG